MDRRSEMVADNVRAVMARTRTTQHMLAGALGLSQQSVSRRLAGLTPFALDELDVVARVLDVPVATLLDEHEAVAS